MIKIQVGFPKAQAPDGRFDDREIQFFDLWVNPELISTIAPIGRLKETSIRIDGQTYVINIETYNRLIKLLKEKTETVES